MKGVKAYYYGRSRSDYGCFCVYPYLSCSPPTRCNPGIWFPMPEARRLQRAKKLIRSKHSKAGWHDKVKKLAEAWKTAY